MKIPITEIEKEIYKYCEDLGFKKSDISTTFIQSYIEKKYTNLDMYYFDHFNKDLVLIFKKSV